MQRMKSNLLFQAFTVEYIEYVVVIQLVWL